MISQDGEWLVFTGCNRPDGFGSCDLYISYLTANGWTEGINLGGRVNSDQWDSQPCLSPDKRDLYFTSRRFGGYGGSDIYVCHLLPNGRWSEPENMGPSINTSGDEQSPFIHADNQTLYFTEKPNKTLLLRYLLNGDAIKTALVFTRTKHGADKLTKDLNRAGIKTEAFHGNKSQNARQAALSNFKKQHTRVLVATDIAARGIDIDDLSHVVNFELPHVPETYVHRIGRTGRAGANGSAISFCDFEEKPLLKDIQKLILKSIPVVTDHPYAMAASASDMEPRPQPQMTRKSSGGGYRSRLIRPASSRSY